MTDQPINRQKCPWCGCKRRLNGPGWICGSRPTAPPVVRQSEFCKRAVLRAERDTLKSKLAQAVEALEAIEQEAARKADHADDINTIHAFRGIEVSARATISTLKDNPQPINKETGNG